MEILDSYPRNENQDGCCSELDPRKCISIISMATTTCGIILALIGYASPRDYHVEMALICACM